MANNEENEGSFWGWALGIGGVVVVAGGGLLYYFWPSEAKAGEIAAPLSTSEARQVPAMACLCWRAGSRKGNQLASCVFKRFRPNAPQSGTTFDDVKGRTDALISQARAAGQDLCDFIEGAVVPPVPPLPEPPAKTKIPNVSKDPKGYNTKAFANFNGFRNALNMMGYTMDIKNEKPPAAKVKQFQRDWNEVSAGVSQGVVKGPWAFKPRGYHYVKSGKVGADGVPGGQVANALEIAQANLAAGRSWQSMLGQSKAAKALDAVKKLFGD